MSLKAVVALAALSCFVACGPRVIRRASIDLHEDGKVVKLIYQPEVNGKTDGSMGWHFGKHGGPTWQPGQKIHTESVYSVVFECQHGTFAIDGNKNLFQKLHEGDAVDIEYHELNDVTEDDEGNVLGTKLADYEFVDANKK